MTVGELIAALKRYNEDTPVMCVDSEWGAEPVSSAGFSPILLSVVISA